MILDTLRELEQSRDYDVNDLYNIADEIEEQIGSAEIWRLLVPAFTADELLQNLLYVAKEADL